MNMNNNIKALDPVTEAEAIRQAQAGSESAKETLFSAYLPAIEAAAHRFRDSLGYDDAFQEASVAFLALIEAHDPERNAVLAGHVRRYLDYHLKEVATETTNPFGIPGRTMRRYLKIMQEAEGDLVAAAALCEKHGMSISTFLDIYKMVGTTSLEGATYGEGGGEANLLEGSSATIVGGAEEGPDAYDAMLTSWEVRALMAELDDESLEVVRLAYGFTPVIIDGEEVDPASSDRSLAAHDDGTVAAAMTWARGEVYSRQKAQRRRAGALKTMREKYETSIGTEVI